MPSDLVLNDITGKIFIGDAHKTFIIAEIGQNHQGNIELAKKLIHAAKEAGADCVKFQKSCLTERFTQSALARPYDSVNSFGPTYGEHRQHLELSDNDFIILQQYATSLNIMFSASAMDEKSLDKMAPMGVSFIKIGSGDANNFRLIEKAAKLNMPLIVSTGMQTFSTVEKIYSIVNSYHKNFVLMHCVSAYPTLTADANLNLIAVYRRRFPDVHIGYSGHEVGSIAHLAVAAGAKVIERHFTLDKNLKGSDHACSLDKKDFREMVSEIRMVEMAMGSSEKNILTCERPCRNKLGKSLVASKTLHPGDILTCEDISVKVSYPAGIPGESIHNIVGLELTRIVKIDDIFEFQFLKKPEF